MASAPTARLIFSLAQRFNCPSSAVIVSALISQLSSALIVASAANRSLTSMFAALIARISAVSAKIDSTFSSRAVMVFSISLPPLIVLSATLPPSTCTVSAVTFPSASTVMRLKLPSAAFTSSSPTVRLAILASVTASRAIYSLPPTPSVMIAVSAVRSYIFAQSIFAVPILAFAMSAIAAVRFLISAQSILAFSMFAAVICATAIAARSA